MKRLFTIFLSFLAAISLWGQQKLPMAIYGDVYNAGPVNSVGQVHLEAGVPTMPKGVARVDNAVGGNFQFSDSVFFYSNDSIDGLFRNLSTVTSTANTVVIVRKYFARNIWYMMSFPFTVNMGPSSAKTTGVKNALDGQGLQRGDGAAFPFDVQYYDPQLRANRGVNLDTLVHTVAITADNSNWQRLDTNKVGLNKDIMYARSAYRIAVTPAKDSNNKVNASGVTSDPVTGGAWIDFISANVGGAGGVDSVFAKKTKGVDLSFATPVYKTGEKPFTDASVGYSEGWNVFGGVSSTEYILGTATKIATPTINYTKTIYYRDDAAGTWKEYNPTLPVTTTAPIRTMRPYAPLFVQTDSSYYTNPNLKSVLTGGGFQYINGNGLVLAPDPSSTVLLRASSSFPYGQFSLNLVNSKDASLSAATYFKFNKSYSTSFSGKKDDLKLNTTSTTEPIVYSLVATNDMKGNLPIFNHGVPYTESVVPLGISIPATGDYSFSFNEIFADNLVVSAVLKDTKNNNKKTELLKGDVYTFHADAGTDRSRFILYLNSKVMTSIEQTGTSNVYAYTDNNTLTVRNLSEGDKVQVVDVTGRVFASGIATGNTFSTSLNQKGVYIVNVRGEKVTTLKVLNK